MSDHPVQPDPHEATTWLKEQAISLGFDLAGIATAEPTAHADHVRQWIASGQAGTMDWMNRHLPSLLDVRTLMPEARSILCVAANYHFPLAGAPATSNQGRIARYALGDDYHEVLKDRLHELADRLRARYPGTQTKCSVDTSPILEREYAARAGIGWVGKNTCVIHPRIGSWIFLGELITSLDLAPDQPQPDHCGTCTRCLDACPTGAITAPRQLDARRCISYLNIEHRGPLTEDQQAALGTWLVGCDICQEVCPFNRKSPEATLQELRPRIPDGTVDLEQVQSWDDAQYRQYFRRSAVRRVKLPVLQTNARSLQRNGDHL